MVILNPIITSAKIAERQDVRFEGHKCRVRLPDGTKFFCIFNFFLNFVVNKFLGVKTREKHEFDILFI